MSWGLGTPLLEYWLFTLAIACLTQSCGSLSLPSIMRVLYHILPTKKKVEIQNSKYDFYCICITFSLLQSKKNLESNHCMLGTIRTLSKILQLTSGRTRAFSGPSDATLMLVTIYVVFLPPNTKRRGCEYDVDPSVSWYNSSTAESDHFLPCFSGSWRAALHIGKDVGFGFKHTWANACCLT